MRNNLRFWGFATLFAFATLLPFAACKHTPEQQLDRDERLLLLDAKIKQHPKDAELYYERGKILIELQQITDAITDFKKAIELDDDEVNYYVALGDAYLRNGKSEDSYKALNKALELDPDHIEANSKMGELLFYSNDLDRAMETLNHLTSIDPNNKTAYMLKGFMYKQQGDTANAVHYFRRVIDLYPDFEPAYEELGVLYAQHHNMLGVEYLKTAIQLEPNNINAIYALAMLYQDTENPEQAIELYTRILEIDPQNKFAWHNRGYIEMILYQDYDNAIEFFTKAIDADNQYVEAHYNRGVAYELKGDRNNAAICYRTALQIDPNYEPATKALEQLGVK